MAERFILPDDIRKAYENRVKRGLDPQLSKVIEELRNELPITFTRQYICERLGGLLTPKTLSNLDALQQGPPGKITLGNRVAYERDDFLEWLEKRVKNSGQQA